MLQETLLSSCQLDIANRIDNTFSSAHTPSFEPYLEGREGRLSGGISIFWRKDLNIQINPILYCDNLMALKIFNNDTNYLLFYVYMPADDRTEASLLKFKDTCAQIQAIIETDIESAGTYKVVITGDFNADPSKGRFWKELETFKSSLSLTCADVSSLPNDSFTYLSPAHNTTSWLDHILVSDMGIIDKVKIEYEKAIYDHFPVSYIISFQTEIGYTVSNLTDIDIKDFIMWDNLTKAEIGNYNLNVNSDLELFYNEALFCRNNNCNLNEHKLYLDKAYNFFINSLKRQSANYTIQGRERKFKTIPGWNSHCNIKIFML